MANLIGTAPNQVPTNGSLGELAFQDRRGVDLVNVVVDVEKGRNYKMTGNNGANAAIVDTGIFNNTPDVGYEYVAMYDVYIWGNPNFGGSSSYKSMVYGQILVSTGYTNQVVHSIRWDDVNKPDQTGVGEFTVSAVFWDGTTESSTTPATTSDNGQEIRIIIDGFNPSWIGTQLEVRLIKRL